MNTNEKNELWNAGKEAKESNLDKHEWPCFYNPSRANAWLAGYENRPL